MRRPRCCGVSWVGLFGAVLALTGLQACRSDETDPAQRNLATSALRANRSPAQLVGEARDSNDADAGQDRVVASGVDAGTTPPSRLKEREQLSTSAVRDTTGLVIDAEWRWSDIPAPANAPESSVEALEALRQATRLRMRIELASVGRMSIAFLGNGYPWPEGTEIRARADRLGHILVWPDGKRYRNVVTGTLRALFTDRRLDRGHLFIPKITHQPPGTALGQVTSKQVLATPVGEIYLEQANSPTAGEGAALLCRFLVELMGVDPESRACSSDQVPLRANLASAPGGKLQFVVNQIAKKQELPLALIQVPPEGASFDTGGTPIPAASSASKGQLEALRHRPVAPTVAAQQAPQQGLVAANRTLALRALLIDGVTVAWLPPGAEVTLLELKAGNYGVSWRDFFGTVIEPSKVVGVPSKVTLGKAAEPGG